MTGELIERVARSLWIGEGYSPGHWDGTTGRQWAAYMFNHKSRYYDLAQSAIAAMQANADLEQIKRERDQAVEALREIDALDGEINPSNYDHDDACYLNRQFCYAGTIASTTLASIEGAGHE